MMVVIALVSDVIVTKSSWYAIFRHSMTKCNSRKLARKKMQREGLLPMKAKVVAR